ncbi:MAG: hypothetical protein OXG91_00620 [bacterium]|nr:hypothetical protein [bacterium]
MFDALDDSLPADKASWWEIIYRAGDVFSDDAGRRGFCARLPEGYRTLCSEAIPT